MMLLSNRLTYCITTFILLVAFAVVPVMAHQPPAGQTFAESHDGVRNSDGQSAAELAAETGHSHTAQPTVSSIELVDTMGLTPNIANDNTDGPTGADRLVSNIDGTTVYLVDSLTAADTARVIVEFSDADSDPNTPDTLPAGEFQLKITFNGAVYNEAGANAQAAPVAGGDDLAAADLTIIAAHADASGVNVGPGTTNARIGTIAVTRVDPTPDDTATNDLSLTEFYVTVPVNAGLAATNLPLSIWISVNADVLFTATQLVGGVETHGRGNAASDPSPFMVQNYADPGYTAPTDPPDTDGPDITTFAKPSAVDADGNLVFTLTFDQSLGARGVRASDFDVTGGTVIEVTPSGAATTYMVKVDPTSTNPDETEVIVTLKDGAVTDESGLPYTAPDTPMRGIFDNVNPTVSSIAGVLNDNGTVTLSITFSEELAANSFINDDIDRTNSNVLLSSTEPMLATTPADNTTVWELTVTPKTTLGHGDSVVIVIKERSIQDLAGNMLLLDTPVTWTRPGPGPGDTTKPVVMLQDPKGSDADDPDDDIVIDESGSSITFTISDDTALAANAAVEMSEVSVSNGTVVSVSGNQITVNPMVVNGATVNTSVTVTVAAGAIADAAGNMSDAVSATYCIGPIFTVPAGGFLVITKTAGMTHSYLSDQPTLPVNANPPTPAPNIMTAVWDNLPDLEVLFSLNPGNGGTINLQKSHNDISGHSSADISEVMWAIDESKRGSVDDAQADEQWVEIENTGGTDIRIILYARTGLDSAIHTGGNIDRAGNAYDDNPGSAGWPAPGDSGNSYSGEDFVSMYRKYVENNRAKGYDKGTKSGAWGTSSNIYLTSAATGPSGGLYDYIGTPGRLHSTKLTLPDTKDDRTPIPWLDSHEALVGGEKKKGRVSGSERVVINEVCNRSDARYEWIELYNEGSAVADLRNFRVSIVTATGTERELFRFNHNDAARIPVGGVLLVVATDPRYDDDHPIAVGKNVALGDADQVAGLGLIEKDADGNSRRAPALYRVRHFQQGGLPDDGKFVLIVRSPDNHENKNEDGKGWAELGEKDLDTITDIAGWTNVSLKKTNYPGTNPTNLNNTDLWPLVNFGAPVNGNNSLAVNRVHYRQHINTNDGRRGTGITHGDQHAHQIAWRDAGYSGIGYKRTARNLAVHYGTPGYHNNTVNNKANSSVTISEVMYSTGENGELPQWIELYNSSATKAVHIGSGWRIRIETLDSSGNALSGLLTIHFGNKGKVKYIYPQQTVLIAAGNARQAGSDFQPASVVFAENRLFNVSREYSGDGALKSDDFVNDRYMFFNPKAFHLALLDKDGAVVDEVGNLDGDVRTNDTVTPDEEFPSAVTEDGVRTSIIRIYNDDGTARDGMKGIVPIGHKRLNKHPDYAWVPAVNTDIEFRITIKSTWYGAEVDYGTPGHRKGLVLPVELSSFRPTLEDGVVTIRWTTESELDNAGFNIYRSETRDGEYKQVNSELIEGAGTTGERSNYNWVDQTAKPGVVYYYQIEDVSFAGEREPLAVTKLKGLISAKNKLTTTWSELKEASQ